MAKLTTLIKHQTHTLYIYVSNPLNMRKIAALILCILAFVHSEAQELSPSMKAWQDLLNKPGLATYFSGIFDHLGIHVIETGERFTVNHLGTHFSLTSGIDTSHVDYIVDLSTVNISNLSKHGADARIDSLESYKIMSVLFTPLTQSSLQSPVLKKPLFRKLSGVEDVIHVYLMSPDKVSYAVHTLIYVKRQWIVVPGIYGTPKRVFKMTPEQAIAYQRKMFEAKKKDSFGGWMKFRKWYKKWRKEVSVKK